MYDQGYQNIYNIDISDIVINQMKDRNKEMRPQLIWETMDCRQLTYKTNFFDLIIDKSTIDALLCGDNAFMNVAIMLKECQRVLKVGGVYMAISYGTPDNRQFHFQRKHLKTNL